MLIFARLWSRLPTEFVTGELAAVAGATASSTARESRGEGQPGGRPPLSARRRTWPASSASAPAADATRACSASRCCRCARSSRPRRCRPVRARTRRRRDSLGGAEQAGDGASEWWLRRCAALQQRQGVLFEAHEWSMLRPPGRRARRVCGRAPSARVPECQVPGAGRRSRRRGDGDAEMATRRKRCGAALQVLARTPSIEVAPASTSAVLAQRAVCLRPSVCATEARLRAGWSDHLAQQARDGHQLVDAGAAAAAAAVDRALPRGNASASGVRRRCARATGRAAWSSSGASALPAPARRHRSSSDSVCGRGLARDRGSLRTAAGTRRLREHEQRVGEIERVHAHVEQPRHRLRRRCWCAASRARGGW